MRSFLLKSNHPSLFLRPRKPQKSSFHHFLLLPLNCGDHRNGKEILSWDPYVYGVIDSWTWFQVPRIKPFANRPVTSRVHRIRSDHFNVRVNDTR